MSTDTLRLGAISILHPDGKPIFALRLLLAVIFLVLGLVKIFNIPGVSEWMREIQLIGPTIWAIALMQFVIALLLPWKITYPMAAWFIVINSVVLMWINFSTTGTLLVSGVVFTFLSLVLIISDRLEPPRQA